MIYLYLFSLTIYNKNNAGFRFFLIGIEIISENEFLLLFQKIFRTFEIT